MKSRDELGWVHEDNKIEVIRVIDAAERASQRWAWAATDFLTPSVHADCIQVLKSMASNDIGFVSFGGYSSAERCRLLVGRREALPHLGLGEAAAADDDKEAEEEREANVAAIEIRGNFIFDPAQHPDFLGACLGTGINRSKVGDILVLGEVGAQALIDPMLVDHFETSLVQVRTVPVKVKRIPLSSLKVREPKMEQVQTIEASLRLDALASFGFKVSRTKMTDLVKGGDVKVNWMVEERASRELKEGDVVTSSGRGRIQIGEIEVTKKDRYKVLVNRFI